MLATHKRLSQDADKLAELIKADQNASVSKKKKAKDARKLEMRVKAALEQGRIEDDVKGVKTDKVMSVTSTKQAMVARVRSTNSSSHVPCLNSHTAAASPRAPHQPVDALRPVRHQKHHPARLPRDPRPDPVHDVREPLHRALRAHIDAAAALVDAHARDVRAHADDLPSERGRVPLRAAQLRALRLLPPQATARERGRGALPSAAARRGVQGRLLPWLRLWRVATRERRRGARVLHRGRPRRGRGRVHAVLREGAAGPPGPFPAVVGGDAQAGDEAREQRVDSQPRCEPERVG
jgi:hypothetical protein